jgi:hypothetical protein
LRLAEKAPRRVLLNSGYILHDQIRRLLFFRRKEMTLKSIDAVLEGQGKYAGKAYFFKDAQYVRYDWGADRPDSNYPGAIALWNLPANFASGIDAALNGKVNMLAKLIFSRCSVCPL